MPVSQLPQAPYRQDRKLFPTPLVGDVLFSEIRDCNRSAFPEYGTPHPDERKWPYHKLVFIKPVDIERNEIFEFFYAADRENQDLYNFASGTKNIVGNVGGREFRIVQRVYVTLRNDFAPFDIPFGTAMPDIPAGQFDGVDYIFFEKQQTKIEQQELDSLYVAETHTYAETALLEYKISYSTQKEDPLPEKFKVQIPQLTTEEIAEGQAEQPTLVTGQLSESQDQLNPDVKLVKKINRNVTSTSTLSGKVITNDLQVGSVEESIVADGTTITPSALTVGGSIETLGNGQSVQKVITVPSLFTAQSYSAERPDPLPSKFRVLSPATTEQYDVAGTATAPTLGGGDLAATEQQVNAFVKKTSRTSRSTSPSPLVGKAVTETLRPATVTETIVGSNTIDAIDTDYKTIEVSIDPLGDGTYLKKVTTVDEWPVLVTREWDHTIRACVERTDTYIDAADIPLLSSSENNVSYKQISDYKALKSTELIPETPLESYVIGIPTKMDFHLPRVLEGIELIWSTASSNGSSTEKDEALIPTQSYSYSTQSGSSGSTSIKVDAAIRYKEIWSSDISVTCYYFYIKSTTGLLSKNDIKTTLLSRVPTLTAIEDWPNFKPVSETIVLKSSSTKSSSSSSSSSTVTANTDTGTVTKTKVGGGSSFSSESSLQTEVITIPPTIHGSITVSGLVSNSSSASLSNSYVSYNGNRARFSSSFTVSTIKDLILYPSNQRLILDRPVINSTSLSQTRYGVQSIQPTGVTQTIYFFSSFFSCETGDEITLLPSGHKFIVSGTPTDPVNNGVAGTQVSGSPNYIPYVDKNLEVKLPTGEIYPVDPVYVTNVIFRDSSLSVVPTNSLQHYILDMDISSSIIGDSFISYPSRHTFIAASDGAAASTTGIAIENIISGFPTNTDTSLVVNELYSFHSDSATDITFSAGSTIKIGTGSDAHIFKCKYSRNESTPTGAYDFTIAVEQIYSGRDPDTSDSQITIFNPVGTDIVYTGVHFVSSKAASGAVFISSSEPMYQSSLLEITPRISTSTVTSYPFSASGSASPTSLSPTSIAKIPDIGNYLVQYVVEPYKWDYYKCKAIILDASEFA